VVKRSREKLTGERIMSIPSLLTVGSLRLHPLWDPLRGRPRFQALLEEYDTD
jgi:hypothetical protein